MTTIAYPDGILAGDTRVTEGDTILPERCEKVFKLDSGALFGAAGSSDQIEALQHALESGHPTPELKHVFGLLIAPDGAVYLYEGKRWCRCGRAPYYATGSGSSFALAAMWCGRSAIDAVKCGIAFDKNSGGDVAHVKLGRDNDRSNRTSKRKRKARGNQPAAEQSSGAH